MYTNVRMKLNARKRERQSVPNTIKVKSSNPARNEVYTIQLYLIKYVNNNLWQIRDFSPGILVSSTNENEHHNIHVT